MKLLLSSFVLLIFSFLSNATFAVSKVTLSGVHICCSTCQETIQACCSWSQRGQRQS